MTNVRPLICVECGHRQLTGERSWKAYLTTDEDEPADAIVYCPECAADEFDAPPDPPPKM